jgi:hypothetical protein
MKTFHAAVAVAAVTLAGLQSTPVHAQKIYTDAWVAVALSPKTGQWASAWNGAFPGIAEQQALKACNAKDAEIVASYQGGWVVMALAEDNTFACVGGRAATGDSRDWKPLAEQALKDLRKFTTKKATQVVVFASGTVEPLAYTPPAYQAGDAVRAKWNGEWYDARVLEVKTGQYRITYVGYGSNYDEWVGEDRLADKPAAAAKYKVDQEVKAEWKGEWYKARVLEVKDGRYKIGYAGYGKEWDEWVGEDRLKTP